MAKAGLFNLTINISVFLVFLSGCAQKARDLPPDLSQLPVQERLLITDKDSPEYNMNCADLKIQLEHIQASMSDAEKQLNSIQASNQAKGSIGILLFPPAMLTMQNNDEISTKYRQLDEKKERILRIQNAHECH